MAKTESSKQPAARPATAEETAAIEQGTPVQEAVPVPRPEAAAPAPKAAATPEGYATRSITLPVTYWANLDSLAERAGVDVSKWLERYLTQFGR